jgi:hypothetical protein
MRFIRKTFAHILRKNFAVKLFCYKVILNIIIMGCNRLIEKNVTNLQTRLYKFA